MNLRQAAAHRLAAKANAKGKEVAVAKSPRQIKAAANAKQLLDHYITLLMVEAGIHTDSDTHRELDEIVDSIIEAATPEPGGKP